MTRVKYSTTIAKDLIDKTKALAKTKGMNGANDIIEVALTFYFQMQGSNILEKELRINNNIEKALQLYVYMKGYQLWEKELRNGKYQTITITKNGMSLDCVEKRITLDVIKDIDKLIQSEYHLVFEVT